jgi:prolyl-tRNA editing enzyme YbaK/EbsC (Cys-tRNA(Pro) deacylase)
LKTRFGAKAKLLTPEEVEMLIGHTVGGMCPFGHYDAIELTMEEWQKCSGFLT